MRILMITETLMTGGAEWFVLRLSDAFIGAGHEVQLFILRPDLIDERMTSQFKAVPIFHAPVKLIKNAVRADRVLQKLFGFQPAVESINKHYLSNVMETFKPDVLHSHLLPADFTTIHANQAFSKRHIITIHGDHIQYIKKGNSKKIEISRRVLQTVDGIVLISDEQKRILSEALPTIASKCKKIYNGYPLPENKEPLHKHGNFTFGMIARGIPEKGWEQAIQAFTRIKNQEARLLFFGESDYLNDLKSKQTDSRITFAGFTNNPLQAINQIDVGLLPTYYPSESLPTTVIEYLALQKPVIATRAGEIAQMMEDESGHIAGVIISEHTPETITEPLFQAMKHLMEETELYHKCSEYAVQAALKFSMEMCLSKYLSIYQSDAKNEKEE
ncbi:MAG: glycosyltransferase family 4 protein [Bacteroidetes bacterium]|nr:glycosyltransferase family 4 protein [Bacteroidota bacterium]MBS1740120.1 glycosyltransferase family 4 protein [Bacteroidota bacterium]